MKIEYTSRGFEIINFKDRYDKECSLQQSSLADFELPGSSAIWFGRGDERMHIDVKQLKEILPHLKKWVRTGSLYI
jgi:hypothetical protein